VDYNQLVEIMTRTGPLSSREARSERWAEMLGRTIAGASALVPASVLAHWTDMIEAGMMTPRRMAVCLVAVMHLAEAQGQASSSTFVPTLRAVRHLLRTITPHVVSLLEEGIQVGKGLRMAV
jgi:hypothetical protein